MKDSTNDHALLTNEAMNQEKNNQGICNGIFMFSFKWLKSYLVDLIPKMCNFKS